MANSSDNFYSQSAQLKLEDGKEYRKKLLEETNRVLSNMLDVLPSVYSSTVPSTNYAKHLKRVATEIARLKLESDNLQNDVSIDTVREEYLYQKFGYQVNVNNVFYPVPNFSDLEYRNFLKAVLLVVLNGSSVANIKKSLHLFTGHPVDVLESDYRQSGTRKNYVDIFLNERITLQGCLENISNIKLSNLDDSLVFIENYDYYIATESLQEQVCLRLIAGGQISERTKVLVSYDTRNAIADQFKLKVLFNLSDVSVGSDISLLIQKVGFLLQIIKPAHVVADIRVYISDDFGHPLEYYTQSAQVDTYLGVDEVSNQRFISNEYDDFRKFTRNEEDVATLEFNNVQHTFNKISQSYGDRGYYLNEPDPLYKKKYQLFQLKGFSAQSSSIFNSPYTLEFNEEQTSILNNSSYFDHSIGNRSINFPKIGPSQELPIRDSVLESDQLKVSALPINFGVSVSSGTFYSYSKAKIVSFDSPTEIILPEEAKGNRVYFYIDLSQSPVAIDYQISYYGNLELEIDYIPLALVDIPEDSLIIWDSYIEDLRTHFFVNLTLRGDSSGFSDFNTSKGIVLGYGTRPIQFKFNDDQSKRVYRYESLNNLNSSGFTLLSTGSAVNTGTFVLNNKEVGYTADDLNFLFADLQAKTTISASGSVATSIKDGPMALGLFFEPEGPDDKVRIFEEDTMAIFNDTLERAESLVVTDLSLSYALASGIVMPSLQVFLPRVSGLLEIGVDYVVEESGNLISFVSGSLVEAGDTLVYSFFQTFGTELNRDLFYGRNTTYATFRFSYEQEDSIPVPSGTSVVETSSSLSDYVGVSVDGLVFNQASVVSGIEIYSAYDEDSQIILNDPDHYLNYPPISISEDILIFDEENSSILNQTLLGPIEQLALESVSIIDYATGLPVIAENGLPVT